MRRCAFHMSELNCPDGGNCPGIMHGTDVDDAEADASERLGEFVEATEDLDKLPPQDSSEASEEHVNAPDNNPRQ